MKYMKMVFLPFFLTSVLMTIYQVGKYYLLEGKYTIWQSHVITIIFTSLIATIVSLSMMNWVEKIETRKREIELQEARLRTLKITMRTVHHIVNNFLNRLLLIQFESEEKGAISDESLRKLEEDITAVSRQLMELGDLENPGDSEEFKKFFPPS